MDKIASFLYATVKFDKAGKPEAASQSVDAAKFVTDNDLTDLFVVSHGWNNNNDEAQDLYDKLFDSVRAVLSKGAIAGSGDRKFGVLGIFWPSKRFKSLETNSGRSSGGAAGVGGNDESKEEISTILDEIKSVLDSAEATATIEEIKALTDKLEDDPTAREEFADKIRSLLPKDDESADDGSDRFFSASGEKLFNGLTPPIRPRRPASSGGAAGGIGLTNIGGAAAGIGDMFRGARAAARRILNYTTYYLMKARARTIGSVGVSETVTEIRSANPDVKVHFVGHSFGGRVVTAATMELGKGNTARPTTVTLLQAAFSHNGFAEESPENPKGDFRVVAAEKIVSGPMLVTHTHNDKACAIAYPIASRFAGQDAAGIGGGPTDRFGAIGANGARHTPEAVDGQLLAETSSDYSFEAAKIFNLEASAYISDHSDVTGQAVANAILRGIATT